jgi:hypothetical protein
MKYLQKFNENKNDDTGQTIEFIRDCFIELEDLGIITEYSIDTLSKAKTVSHKHTNFSFKPMMGELAFTTFIKNASLALSNTKLEDFPEGTIGVNYIFQVDLKMPTEHKDGFINNTDLLLQIIYVFERIKSNFIKSYLNLNWKGTNYKPIEISIELKEV